MFKYLKIGNIYFLDFLKLRFVRSENIVKLLIRFLFNKYMEGIRNFFIVVKYNFI